MSPLVWPRDLLPARVITPSLEVPSAPAGSTLGGVPQSVFWSGGPYWRWSLSQVVVRRRAAILAARALQGALDAGQRPILVRPCECRLVPLAGDHAPIVASIASASLRATTVTVEIASGGDPDQMVGAHWSVINPTWGERMHRIIRRTGGADDAPQFTIRPGLREAIASDTDVNFNTPGLLMRLDGRFALTPTIKGRLYDLQATFCELERPPVEGET